MTLSLQFVSLLLLMVSGILIGAIIEGTRFLTGSFSKRSFIFKSRIGIEVIIWISLGLGTFFLLYEVRDGVWRVYDPLAQLLGILLYEKLFQPAFQLTGRIFLRLIVKPIWFILHAFITLIGKISSLIFLLILVITKPFRYIYLKTLHLALQKKPNFRYNKKYTKN
ncbi:hypothetical protein PB01_00330 [Psychrobacillus glaciei]|uniref:Spore cortex biosynthesis protein YabQ n=1 Tax=Psychrobacillus glaciei TaxID=2283160 RepID=A0A5J6SHN8_9BACI|nr:hypothetical protein PB01_00330 [Psychrobacillus glaciei]